MSWLKKIFRRWTENDLEDELRAWRIVEMQNDVENSGAVLRLRIVRPENADASFTTVIQLFWNYEGGMPSADVNERQLAFEKALDPLLGDNGFSELVQVATGIGAKEWLFYSANASRFFAEYRRLLAGHEPYPVEVACMDDPHWEVWSSTVETVRNKTT
jgi:hypothetical protein